MMWYDDPLLLLGVGLLGLSLVFAGVVGVCLILLWYGRRRQNYAYDRLPINWGEPLIQERTVADVVVDLDVAEIQNDLISLAHECYDLRARLEESERLRAGSERARRRHLATVRRLRRELGYDRAPVSVDTLPLRVPELWTLHHGSGDVLEVRPRGNREQVL